MGLFVIRSACFLVMVGVLLSSPARADTVTEIHFGCAPWDGRTLELEVSVADGAYRATLWGAGFEEVRKGSLHLVQLEKTSDMAGTGRAMVCSSSALGDGRCQPQPLVIEFEQAEITVGGRVAGAIHYHDMVIPFKGTIAPVTEICG